MWSRDHTQTNIAPTLLKIHLPLQNNIIWLNNMKVLSQTRLVCGYYRRPSFFHKWDHWYVNTLQYHSLIPVTNISCALSNSYLDCDIFICWCIVNVSTLVGVCCVGNRPLLGLRRRCLWCGSSRGLYLNNEGGWSVLLCRVSPRCRSKWPLNSCFGLAIKVFSRSGQ